MAITRYDEVPVAGHDGDGVVATDSHNDTRR